MIKMLNRLKVISFLAVLSLHSLALANPSNNMKVINGSVYDAQTQEPLIGVTVFIKGLNKGTTTDVNGDFNLTGVSGTKCTLVFSYISYKTIETDYDPDDTAQPLKILMETETVDIGEVVVRGRMRKNTESSLIVTQKSLAQVTSGISATQISKSPDRVVSEVMKRVSGVTVIDERFIIVRGLSQRYNNAWINGLAVPSTEIDSRAFPLDLLPASQVDNLLVFKSPSPEIPGDFSGGFVKITSKDIPDENNMEIGYTTGFNVNTQFRDFRYNPGSGAGFNDDWRVKSRTPLPDQRLSLMIARRVEKENGKMIGNITAVNYSHTFKTIRDIKNARYGVYSSATDAPVYFDDYTDNQFVNDSRLGLLHNWTFVLSPAHRIEFKNLLNFLGRNRLTERSGIKDISSMYYREQTEMQYTSRLTYSGQFSGTHELSNERTLQWDAGYSFANRDEPDRRIVTNQAGIGSVEDIPSVTTINDNISRYFQNMKDHGFSAAFNYKRILSIGDIKPVLKTGLYGEYRDRDFTNREFVYRYNNLSYEERQQYLKLPFEEMLREQYLGDDKVYLDETTKKTNDYSATVGHLAGYAALDIPLGKVSVYAGARLESHNTKLTRDKSMSPDTKLMDTKDIHDIHVLPSVNMTWKISGLHQIRGAYGISVNRPELREISPAVYFDFDLFSEVGGNENLKTAVVNNADLRYEYYPAHGEVLSVGVFYKHFKNPIEWTFIDMGGSLRYLYENARQARSYGIEVEIRKKLLPSLTLMLNGALIKNKVSFNPGEVVTEIDRPMQGQSPYIMNAGLYYQPREGNWDISLLYNRIGKRIVGLGKSNTTQDVSSMITDSYEMPRDVLDLTVSKGLGKHVDIRFSVKDILSGDIVFKQFPKFEKDGKIMEREQITRRYNPGQSVSLGITVKL